MAGADPAAAELLRRASHGDRGAYGQVVLRFQDRLFNAILRMVGDRDEAAELTQETFTRGLAGISGFRGDAAPYTWLFRIGLNLAITRLRQVQRRRVFSLDRPSSATEHRRRRSDDQAAALIDRANRSRGSGESPSAVLERREQSEQVLAALGRLDAEQRSVLVMRDIEGFDYQQMADLLGLPLGTLKSRLFRARIALRDQLKSYMNSR